MELYEQIRREYEFGAGTIAGVARKLGVHRRMVRDAVRSAIAGTAEEDRAAACEDRTGRGVYRRGSGSGSQGSAQAAPHGQAHLGAHSL